MKRNPSYYIQKITYEEALESLSEEERTNKRVRKDLSYLNKVFKGKIPKWMVDGVKDVYKRTKNIDRSKLNDKGVF